MRKTRSRWRRKEKESEEDGGGGEEGVRGAGGKRAVGGE